MDSFKKWLEDTDKQRRLEDADTAIEKPVVAGTALSPWHGQKKMKKKAKP